VIDRKYNRGKDGTHPLDKSFQSKPEGVVEKLGGDDLQTLYVTWHALDDFSRPKESGFWDMLEDILAQCDEVMLRHGWDRRAGNGRNFPGDRTAEPFSELWYAGKIAQNCWNFLTHHKPSAPNTVMLSQAIELGKMLSQFEWHRAFKPSTQTGRKQRKNLAEHRGTAKANRQAEAKYRRKIVSQMLRETNLTKGALERYLQKELERDHSIAVATRTIRRDLKQLQRPD